MSEKNMIRLYQFATSLLLAFAGWVFVQFWSEAKELKAEVAGLRIDVVTKFNQCEVGLLNLEHRMISHEVKASQ